MKIVLLFFILVSNVTVLKAQELDRLALVSLLIKNNNLTRAQAVLREIKDPNDVQTDRFFVLKGILALKQKRYEIAINELTKAEKSGLDAKDLPEFYETLIKCYLLKRDYPQAEKVITDKKNLIESRPLYFQLLSKLYFETSRDEEGWNVLNRGIEKFPDFFSLKKQKWFYLYSHNLLELSKEYLFEIIEDKKLSALDLAKIAYQYRSKRELKTAATIGELAKLKSPGHEEIIKELVRIYIEKKNILAAAQTFEQLAQANPKFMAEASELWRKAGYKAHAERLAMQIHDPQKALEQKMALALENKNFLQISQLSPFIQRSKLKHDQDVQYTLAYSHFMLGDFSKVESFLSQITRNDLLKKALVLRETIQNCEKNEGACL